MMSYARVLPQVKVWIGNTGLAQGERYLIVNPFFHSFGMKVGWVACLMAGAVMVPMPQFDVEAAADCIERDRINFLPGAPTIFQMLIARKREKPFDTSSLRGGTTGAATVPPILIEQIREELGIQRHHHRLWHDRMRQHHRLPPRRPGRPDRQHLRCGNPRQ